MPYRHPPKIKANKARPPTPVKLMKHVPYWAWVRAGTVMDG